MVFYINKQAVEIKSNFPNAPLTSINECCCAVGILAKIYGLPLPQKFDTLEEMKKIYITKLITDQSHLIMHRKLQKCLMVISNLERLMMSYTNY